MAENLPLVSIGMPVYNGNNYIVQALDSLLAQTFRDFELIISDNGSTDGTEAIGRAYAHMDPRISYFREDVNRGACWNFNRVFALSRAPYFKWAAADDLCAPTFLEKCVSILEKNPSIVCCHTKTQKIDSLGLPIKFAPDPTDGGMTAAQSRKAERLPEKKPDASSLKSSRRFRDVLLSSGWAVRCSGLIRSRSLASTNMIKPVYGYEKVTMAELSLMGRFHTIPEILFFQRVHKKASSNLTSSEDQQKFICAGRQADISFPRLELLKGYVSAVRRFPLTSSQRLMCSLGILRYLFQMNKWNHVLLSVFRGTGTGG